LRKRILNIFIDDISLKEFLKIYKSGIVFTPNVDHLIKLQKNEEFYNSYLKADYILLDSQVLKILLRIFGIKIYNKISGSDLFPAFYNYHKDNENLKIFILGGLNNVAELALQKINNKCGREIVVGAYSPALDFLSNLDDINYAIGKINSCSANVLAVCLGAPKQEIWISKYLSKLKNIKMVFALGAVVDFEAGSKKRAPVFLQKIGFEWLFRMIFEPKRLIKRYLYDDIPIIYYLFLQKIGRYKNPFIRLKIND